MTLLTHPATHTLLSHVKHAVNKQRAYPQYALTTHSGDKCTHVCHPQHTKRYDEVSRSESRGEELRDAAKERWEVLLEKGLGMIVKDEDIPLATAQDIVKLQSMKMQSDEFLVWDPLLHFLVFREA
jgi:hypothetical protein